jgi:hypothetical protein
MHRSALTRTERRTRCSRRLRPCGTLKNWLPGNRSSRRRTRRHTAGSSRRSGRWQRRLVHGARSGLRHDHSRRRRNWSCWPRGRRARHLRDICRRRRSAANMGHRSRSRNSGRNGDRRRRRTARGRHHVRGRGRRRHRSFGWNHDHRRRAVGGGYRSRRHHSGRGRCRRFCRGFRRHCPGRSRCGRRFRLHLCCWHRNGRFGWRARCRLLGRSLLLRNGAEHISRPRDVGQVDLGLDAVIFAGGTRSFRRSRRAVRAPAEMFPHQFRFVLFQRT